LCSVLLGKLHIQALGFYMIMLGLSFSLLQVNVSLSNQLAKGFMQDGCFVILGLWDDSSITLEFVICKRRQTGGNFGTSNSLSSRSWLV